MTKIKTIELFAGVGGFRVGLEKASEDFQFVWSNQWEPSSKVQHASSLYCSVFGTEGHSNKDICSIPAEEIPDCDLMVAGFPCQDYSVARPLSSSSGIKGKKGVLWWQIYRLLKDMENRPKYVLFENVDRLLTSPSGQRGRDFGIILSSLNFLGYAVEWKMINAADYGMPQKRRRVYIFGCLENSDIYRKISGFSCQEIISEKGIISRAFPSSLIGESATCCLSNDVFETSNSFSFEFGNCGFMNGSSVLTNKYKSSYIGDRTLLGDVLVDESIVPESFFLDSVDRWTYLKGGKKEKRIDKKTGFEYQYCEGRMPFPDSLDSPSRTIITSEGGSSPSRFKHVVKTPSGRLRRLLPIELERLNMFPDNHTLGVSDSKRAFLMGNALVTGIIERIGKSIISY